VTTCNGHSPLLELFCRFVFSKLCVRVHFMHAVGRNATFMHTYIRPWCECAEGCKETNCRYAWIGEEGNHNALPLVKKGPRNTRALRAKKGVAAFAIYLLF
jgi:hypothetical protein